MRIDTRWSAGNAGTPPHYFIVMPAGAIAAGMFSGGGHGPDCISAKTVLSDGYDNVEYDFAHLILPLSVRRLRAAALRAKIDAPS